MGGYLHEGPLNKDQFNRGSGPGHYQLPLPGTERMLPALPKDKFGEKSSGELRIDSLYNPQHNWEHGFDTVVDDPHSENWATLTRNYHPQTEQVPMHALRPTQPHINEAYMHSPADKASASKNPNLYKSNEGHYYVQDGHHRLAREMLNGKQFATADVWHESWLNE